MSLVLRKTATSQFIISDEIYEMIEKFVKVREKEYEAQCEKKIEATIDARMNLYLNVIVY